MDVQLVKAIFKVVIAASAEGMIAMNNADSTTCFKQLDIIERACAEARHELAK